MSAATGASWYDAVAGFIRKYTGPVGNMSPQEARDEVARQAQSSPRAVLSDGRIHFTHPPELVASPDPLAALGPASALDVGGIAEAKNALLGAAATTTTSAADALMASLCAGPELAVDPSPASAASSETLESLLAALRPDAATLQSNRELGDLGAEQCTCTGAPGLVRAWSAREDLNERGQRRGKRRPHIGAGGQPRFAMEDAHVCQVPLLNDADGHRDQALFGVFDGFAGSEASREAVSVLPHEFAAKVGVRGQALQGAEGCANEQLFRDVFSGADERMKQFEFVGTTCTVVLVWSAPDGSRYVQAANVGDSNAFLCRGGKAVAISQEHKVANAEERARLREMGFNVLDGQTRINGIAVSRALGNSFVKEQKLGITATPFISPCYKLSDADSFVVLASDGLWDVMSGQQACDLIASEASAEAMAAKLIRTALSNTKCTDNITVIVVCL
eukprot:m51a1_g1964 putative protein phosphatase 2c (449) ;mRNA; r:1076487-1078023